MTDNTQPEALRLAHIFDHPIPPDWPDMVAAAAELRRQHARIAELEAELEAVGAGGVQALSAAPVTVSDTQHSQFLSDVLTAAGLITHGKRCKALGERLSDMVMRLRAAPQQEAQEPTAISEAIERMAADRYKVVPSHESMFHRWAVVAGTGTQQLYLGREVECQNMARKFAGAFLDGAFVAMQQAAPKAAPQQKAHHLTQALTDPENQPNQYGVEFGMSGQQMHFKIGNQLFRLAYEPDDQQEFEFMKRMLIHAFSTFTPDVKTAPQPAPAPLSEMPYEKRKTIQEGEQIGASDAWFKARHEMLDTVDRRNVFRAGFDRGWNAALAAQGDTP